MPSEQGAASLPENQQATQKQGTPTQDHRRGLVHKDIKPANILFNGTIGQVKLTRFGIANFGRSPEAM